MLSGALPHPRYESLPSPLSAVLRLASLEGKMASASKLPRAENPRRDFTQCEPVIFKARNFQSVGRELPFRISQVLRSLSLSIYFFSCEAFVLSLLNNVGRQDRGSKGG